MPSKLIVRLSAAEFMSLFYCVFCDIILSFLGSLREL